LQYHLIFYYSPEAKHSFETRVLQSWKYSTGQKHGVQAFGYNSVESETIWIKSGALWANCWGLALADCGRYPRSSDSL